jgi:O-antigen/teichoic acid export membrane protein
MSPAGDHSSRWGRKRPQTPGSLREPAEASGSARDAAIAVKSAFVLGASLLATWSVALVVRLYLPRHLGPEVFGAFNFADTFAATFFIFLGLGVETYIQKVIPVRPAHASDFLGGFVVLRVLLGAAVVLAMAVVMNVTHRPPEVQRVVFVFGAAQLLVSLNNTLASLLHASRAVSGLAIVNVASKALWGLGVAAAVIARVGLVGLALAFLAAEAVRATVLARLAQRHLGLRLRVDPAAVRAVILASLPFYLNTVANTIYGKVDVTLLTLLTNDAEVGFYGAASNLASLALLVSPLVGSVLLPLFSRAAARSPDELFAILRRVVEAVLLVVIPISLFAGLGADVWIPLLFGRAFVPAIPSLRLLAPIFVITYLAMITAASLILLDRAWRVAAISLGALVVNPLLNLALVPVLLRWLGPGGAGAGAALSLLVTEACVTAAMTLSVRARSFDRQSARTLGKALLCCLAVVAVDRVLAPLGPARLAADAVAYVALALAVGAVPVAEIKNLACFLLRERHQHASA